MTSSCLKTELSYLFLLTLYSSSAYGCTPNQTIIIILIECRPFKQSLTSKNRKLYQLPLYYPSSFKFQLNVSDSSPTRFKCGQFSLCTHLVQSDRPFIIFKFTKTDMRHPRSPFFSFQAFMVSNLNKKILFHLVDRVPVFTFLQQQKIYRTL